MQNLRSLKKYLNQPIRKNSQIYFRSKKIPHVSNEKFKTFLKVTKNFDENPLIEEGGKRVKRFYRRSLKSKPLITIVTVVLNDKKNIENTIKSVLLQKYDNIEYIIIDGGSSGGTISKIKKYENYIDYWISQKDMGIYDAWNKGIRLATGDMICFLNVRDFFTENAIKNIVEKIKKKKNIDIIFGAVRKKQIYSGFYPEKLKTNLNIFPSFVSTFINLKIYKRIGLFDLKFKCFNDYELIYRLLKSRKFTWSLTGKDQVIVVFDLKGFSSKISFADRIIEEFKIRIKYENVVLVFIKMLLKVLRYYQVKVFFKDKFEKYN